MPEPAAIRIDFDLPKVQARQSQIAVGKAWAKVFAEPSQTERVQLKARIKQMLRDQNAVLVAHYYVHPDLQDLAEETGGCVSDSLEMARFGRPPRRDRGGVRGALHGGDGKNSQPGKARADAGT